MTTAITTADRLDNPTYVERDGFLYPPTTSDYQYRTDPATLVGQVQIGDVIRYSVTVMRGAWSGSAELVTKTSAVRSIHRDAYGLYLGTTEVIDEDTAWEDQASTVTHTIEIVTRHRAGDKLIYTGHTSDDLRGTAWTWIGPCDCGQCRGRGMAENARYRLRCVSAAHMVTPDDWRAGRNY